MLNFGFFPWDFPAYLLLVKCYSMLSAAAEYGNDNGMYILILGPAGSAMSWA